MAIEPAGHQVIADTNRKVWVVNNYTEPHVEKFRGDTITVPPHGVKQVMMPYLTARRFLGQPTPVAEQDPHGKYMAPPKMLKVVEMTKEELMQLDGLTPDQIEAKQRELEEKAALVCGLCGFQAVSEKGLKIHTTKEHPDRQPVSDKNDTGTIHRDSPEAA